MADDNSGFIESGRLGCLTLAIVPFFLPGVVISELIWPQQTPNQMAGRGALIGLGLFVLLVVFLARRLFRRS